MKHLAPIFLAIAAPATAQMVPIERAPGAPITPAPRPIARATVPPAVIPTVPPLPAIPFPTLSPAQAVWVTEWLNGGRDQGLTANRDLIGAVASQITMTIVGPFAIASGQPLVIQADRKSVV